MARSHCESSSVGPVVYLMNADSDGCQAFRPSQTTWAATVHIHHRHFIISVPESWYSFYRPTKGRRLSRPRHCSKEHRLSNKLFFIWLLTTPPHLKYVATLPCNWSLIACFLTWMFHKVVCQHRQGDTMWNDAGSCAWPISELAMIITTLLQIYQKIFQWKKCENRLRFDRNMAMSLWPHFFGPAFRL